MLCELNYFLENLGRLGERNSILHLPTKREYMLEEELESLLQEARRQLNARRRCIGYFRRLRVIGEFRSLEHGGSG